MSRFALPILFLLFSSRQTYAATQLDQMIGVRLSLFASQKILSTAPLPSIEPDRKFRFIPSASILKSKVSGDFVSQARYSGSFNGWSAGAGFTSQSESNLSWYGYVLHTNLEGSIAVPASQASAGYKFELKNISSTGYNISTGLNLRLWAAESFPFTLGLIGGGYLSRFASSYDSSDENPASDDGHYKAVSYAFGPVVGVQFFANVFGLKLNPYALRFDDVSDHCQSYTTTSNSDTGTGDESDRCTRKDAKSITLKGSFMTYGLNIGVFGLSFGVYSYVKKDSSLDSFQVTNYALSYSFPL